METPPNGAAAKDFQVTGVSRSGRVRKKSSKLLDYQSPDEVEKKHKRTPKSTIRGMRGRPPLADSPWKRKSAGDTTLSTELDDVTVDDNDDDDFNEESEQEEEAANATDDNRLHELTFDANASAVTKVEDEDDELDELVADIVEGVEAEADANANGSGVRQSLYMTEKSNKQKILKDGRVVTGKIQRKDKGKTRFTAYSLWAREFRKSPKFGMKQDLDFAQTARRLSELWANVPNNEKNVWRRKAKRLAANRSQKQETAITDNDNAAGASNSSFLNRATTSRTKKLAADKQMSPKPNKTTPTKRARKTSRTEKSSPTNYASTMPTSNNNIKVITTNINNNSSHLTTHHNTKNAGGLSHVRLPMSGIAPIDAAAHLKLLGESLSIIGERLKEHEGQITVSGSLSVLLDSLLCSVGPLLCLTTRLPGLEKRKELSDNLTSTLDNIAYVMPGL